jgi:hypothetical protein
MIDDFLSVDMNTVDVSKLVDISTLKFDYSLSKKERMEYVERTLKNPFCFRYGNMGIGLAFDDTAPPLEEVITRFLIRKKSGL